MQIPRPPRTRDVSPGRSYSRTCRNSTFATSLFTVERHKEILEPYRSPHNALMLQNNRLELGSGRKVTVTRVAANETRRCCIGNTVLFPSCDSLRFTSFYVRVRFYFFLFIYFYICFLLVHGVFGMYQKVEVGDLSNTHARFKDMYEYGLTKLRRQTAHSHWELCGLGSGCLGFSVDAFVCFLLRERETKNFGEIDSIS
jgi:hypothetical protein